jgi:hypothetical protein
MLVTREVQEGVFTPRVESFGLESGVIKWVSDRTIDASLRERVAAAADSIIAGTLVVAGQGVP